MTSAIRLHHPSATTQLLKLRLRQKLDHDSLGAAVTYYKVAAGDSEYWLVCIDFEAHRSRIARVRVLWEIPYTWSSTYRTQGVYTTFVALDTLVPLVPL